MEIFLVRHGETGSNVAHRHQVEDAQLSFVGEEQAKAVAETLKQYEPTHLVTSNLVRAVETARVIGDACDLIPETNYRFVELARPDHLYGRYHKSIKSMWFYLQWYLGQDTQKDTGGESYKTLRERIKSAQASLAEYPEDARVVVVSHAVFISMFVAHLCSKRPLSPFGAVLAFKKILTIPNAHVVKISFNSESTTGTCAWSVDS